MQLPAKLYKSIGILKYVITSGMIANQRRRTIELTLTSIERTKIFSYLIINRCALQKNWKQKVKQSRNHNREMNMFFKNLFPFNYMLFTFRVPLSLNIYIMLL